MNRKEAKEYLPIMQAFADGKKIETRCDIYDWTETEVLYLESNNEYRIKPEPKYRPFNTAEECWNEMLKHEPFGFLSITDKHDYFSICRVFEEEGKPKITYASNPYSDFDMTKAFDRYQFVDGTPFGGKEE